VSYCVSVWVHARVDGEHHEMPLRRAGRSCAPRLELQVRTTSGALLDLVLLVLSSCVCCICVAGCLCVGGCLCIGVCLCVGLFVC
jgi:hypothetical protein